jgi:hypothetical protein
MSANRHMRNNKLQRPRSPNSPALVQHSPARLQTM